MYYIIQENLFREEGHARLIGVLDCFGIPYEIVKIIPFIDEVKYITLRKDVFVFGSLKLARLAKKYKWFPGAVVTSNHDYEVYSKHYKEHMLNYDSRICSITDNFDWKFNQQFIRPCLDSKVFVGQVFDKEDWVFFRDGLFRGDLTSLTKHTRIQVASPKKITQEVRFWVVGGRIVTQSIYRRGYFLCHSNIVDNDAIDFAQRMLDIFQLARAFVIDIGLTDDGWKIIECGSISCAGFYEADMQKIVMSLEDEYK